MQLTVYRRGKQCFKQFFSSFFQYSCFFVYLRLVMNFSKENVALFIAAIGILSVVAQVGTELVWVFRTVDDTSKG
jgi:hypothetical protein